MNEYACPTCGWFWDDFSDTDPSIIDRKDVERMARPWNDAPGGALKWTEVHLCPECGTTWEFGNANY